MKTIYISGPITDQTTGQPREGWQRDFLDAEAKLRRIGFAVINPVDIAREVEEANRWQYECTSHACTCNGGPIPPSRADYIMACLQRMKLAHSFDRLHGVYIIGKSYRDVVLSYGVQMEVLMAEVLDVPVYAECRDDNRINRSFLPMEYHGTIEELLNGTMSEQTMIDKENNIGGYDHKAVIDAAMAEVEEKARAFTAATQGESSEEILAQMRGEQKTAEWSEEDEQMLASFLNKLEVCELLTNKENTWAIKKFTSLKPQPKPEWSEEDERLFQIVIDILDRENHLGNISHTDLIACVRKLKSLKKRVQPQQRQEWSEEDERKIEFLISLVNEWCNTAPNATSMIREEISDWLKSLKSQKQWKPSKEMLEALKWAKSEFHPDCQETMNNLNYLYKEIEQLYYDRT